jgi:UDP-galactopyranose mutase
MCEWLSTTQMLYETITNSEEIAKSRVGDELYNTIFKNYTFKQWGKYPNELNPDVLARIPIRTNFDDRYFTDKYQVLPKYGYTEFFKTMLHHANITVRLNTDFFAIKESIPSTTTVIYTGPIDRYFADQGLEPLEYRSLNIVFESHKNTNFYQTHTQVNYPGLNEPFTRITEYKHCLHQSSPHTTISKEYSTDQGEPYYPVLSDRNVKLFEKYQQLADVEMTRRNIHFLGRLANYKYFNMDQAIKNAIDYFHTRLVGESST